MEEIVLVLTTLPESFDAESLARDLVEGRLAACVSVLPLQTSTYHWQGAIEIAREHECYRPGLRQRITEIRNA